MPFSHVVLFSKFRPYTRIYTRIKNATKLDFRDFSRKFSLIYAIFWKFYRQKATLPKLRQLTLYHTASSNVNHFLTVF